MDREHMLWTSEAIGRFRKYLGGLSYGELRRAHDQLHPFEGRSVYSDQAAITRYVIGCKLSSLD